MKLTKYGAGAGLDNDYQNNIIIIMNGTTVLQIPMDKTLRQRATLAAKRMGFSSLQEVIRIFLMLLAERKLRLGFELKSSPLTSMSAIKYTKLVQKQRG